jgi:hypothetical protein
MIEGRSSYMFGKSSWSEIVLAAAGILMAGAQIGAASTFTVNMLDASGPSSVFQYTITLDGASAMTPGEGFAVYGFTDYVGDGATPAAATVGGPDFNQFTIETTSNDFAGSNLASYSGPSIKFVYDGSSAVDASQSFGLTMLSAAEMADKGESAAEAAIAEDKDPLTNSSLPISQTLGNDPVSNIALAPLPRALIGGLSLFGLVQVRQMLRRRRLAHT